MPRGALWTVSNLFIKETWVCILPQTMNMTRGGSEVGHEKGRCGSTSVLLLFHLRGCWGL